MARAGTSAAEKWAQRVATNLTAWGFNTLGFHNPLSQSLQSAGPAYYVVQLDLPVPWGWNMSRSALLNAFRRRPFDIFGDEFETNLARLFALPYFIGWHHCGYMRGLRKPYLEALKRGDRKVIDFHVNNRCAYREGFITEQEEQIEPLLSPLSRALHACEDTHRAATNMP